MTDPSELLRSAVAGRYMIEKEIGHGGMARVFLAQDLKHRRPVAVKVLRPELAAVLGAERFLREIEIEAKLTHPHIVPLYDSGDAAGLLYYVMPFIEGESLRDRLTREKQLPLDDALKITRDVADALAYAHRHDVIHRDVKPENILLEGGHALVTDFGIARAITAAAGERLTETGVALGTPAYMSPEQVAGDDLDGRADVYSLGCVLYEMLAGQPPFTGRSAQAVFARRMTDPVPPLRTVRERIPEQVDRAIETALAKAPADRFTTAAQFAGALSDRALAAPRSAWKRPGPRLVAAASIAAALVVAMTLAIVRTISGPSGPVSATRVAVLPFAIRGSGSFDYLAEGMVDLLSRGLDGTGELRTVDPGTILTAVGRSGGGPVDAERGRAFARRVGAGAYVIGSIHAVGGRVRIQAALYDERAGAKSDVSVEGDSTQLFELVDRLSAQLLVKRGTGVPSRLAETAAITTRSLGALKAYLEAERRLRTASLQPAKLDSAIAMFQQAVSEDSTFALAHYRLAVAAGWANRPRISTAAARRALTLSDRLGERDRRLLAAYVEFRRGAANEAERQYRAILADYPDDLEAMFQLGDVLYNYNPLRGRPRREAREPFNQVLELDPGFL